MALPFACDLTMVPGFLGRTHFLQLAFLASEPLTPVLCCICEANSDPLPGSTLLTPHFSIQPPAAQRLSKLIQNVVLRMATLRTTESTCVEEALAGGMGKMIQWEPLPVPLKAKEVGRWERGYDGSPAPCMPLNNDT